MFRNSEGKVRSGWKIAAAYGAFFVVISIVGSIVGVIFMFAAVGQVDSISSFWDEYTAVMAQWNWLFMVLQTLSMIAVPVFAWKVIFKRCLDSMGLPCIKGHTKELGWGLLLGAGSMTIIFLLLVVTGVLRVVSRTPVLSADTFLYMLVFILVGIAEESFYRGYCMSVLRQTRSIALIFVISSVLFSLVHATNFGYSFTAFINIAIAGLLFAYMYMRSGNIWMPIGFHITWNYFQGSVFGLSTSGNSFQGLIKTEYVQVGIWGGGAFGPEEGLFTTFMLLVCFLFVKWYYRKYSYDFLTMDMKRGDTC